ncbi:MAG: hypothetical protein ONA90_01820 [candidate division KSB1 bacterium]|nr:hypothetical protein [candidate division KSB1 bacterium]
MPSLSKKKEFLFRALLIFVPLLILLAAEFSLRLFGYGDNLDLFMTLEKNPSYWITNPKIGRRYFLRQNFLPATSYDAFLKKKPDHAYRIFVLGESAAAGFPYFNNGSFPRLLRTRLQAHHPDKIIEVVNLGLPAVSSFALLDLADELVDYQPDAILIYAGHNEFYGAQGSASTESLGRSRGLVRLSLRLQHFKLVQLIRNTLFALKIKAAPASERNTLMARMAGEKHIAYRGELYNSTLRTFRDNLAEIIHLFKTHGIQVMLSELVSNIGDQPPFASLFHENTDRAIWQNLFDRGLALARADSFEAAVVSFHRAAGLDESPAILHFEMAKCLMQLGKLAEAKQAFVKAKDLDALRFRASEDFNETIRELGTTFQVPVVPMATAFTEASPSGIIGSNLMLEHLHPNLHGYFLMAKTFFEHIERQAFISSNQISTALSDSIFWARRGVTALDEELARLRIQVLMSNWPFQSDPQKVTPLQYSPRNRLEELALAQWQEQISWDGAHIQLAEYYTKTRQPENAALEYEALVIGMPYVVTPYLRLGLTYLTLNRLDDAFDIFEQSLSIEASALAQKWLGAISIHKNRLAEGLAYLHQALQREPNDPETLYNISIGYAKSGDFGAAKDFAAKLIERHPNYPGARAHWQKLQSLK